jgi:endonuclease/exonuclease/phosphatase family metal-dependent hydrolase
MTTMKNMTTNGTLRVMTLNVAHGARGPMPAALLSRRKILSNLDAIGSVIRVVDADVVALQEVDRACAFSGRIDHLERIANAGALPFRIHAPHGEHRTLRMRHGHALLSRLRFGAKEHRRFARRLCHDKGFVVATVMLDGSREIDVVSAHLEPFSKSTRRSQILELSAALNVRRKNAQNRPLVLMGDMNCGYHDEDEEEAKKKKDGIALLTECLGLKAWNAKERLLTYSTLMPVVRFDWILVSPELSITSHETRHERISDHAAVVAEIAIA